MYSTVRNLSHWGMLSKWLYEDYVVKKINSHSLTFHSYKEFNSSHSVIDYKLLIINKHIEGEQPLSEFGTYRMKSSATSLYLCITCEYSCSRHSTQYQFNLMHSPLPNQPSSIPNENNNLMKWLFLGNVFLY